MRQRLTELGVSFVARPVPADRVDREELHRKTRSDEISVPVLEDGTPMTGDAVELIAQLDERFSERADAQEHRERAAESDRPKLTSPSAAAPSLTLPQASREGAIPKAASRVLRCHAPHAR